MHCKGKQARAPSISAASSDPLYGCANHTQTDIVWAFNAPAFSHDLTGSERDADILLLSISGVLTLVLMHRWAPRRVLQQLFGIRLRAPRAPLRRQGWGNTPLLRRGNSISSLPALTQSTGDGGEKRCDVACQGQRSGYTAASLPLVPLRNALLPGPLPCSLVALLRPLAGPIPGLSRTEGHKSHANSEVFIFSKNPHLAS